MKIFITTAILSFWASSLYAYKVAIYTDQTDHSKADEVIALFNNTHPFNQFDIEFEVVDIKATDLACAPDAAIARLPRCNTTLVAERAAALGADQAMVVWNTPTYGGAGGSVPVMTVGSSSRVMLHEFLHTLNFADEYKYSASEATTYCTRLCPNGTKAAIALAVSMAENNRKTTTPSDKNEVTGHATSVEGHEVAGHATTTDATVETDSNVICAGKQRTTSLSDNLAYIHPEVTYTDDAQARNKHENAIAWYDQIPDSTLITQDEQTKLGTGSVTGDAPISPSGAASGTAAAFGLYRAQTCDNADPVLPTWSPSPTWTVMDRISLGLGPEYEAIVEESLASRGITRKNPTPRPSENETPASGENKTIDI